MPRVFLSKDHPVYPQQRNPHNHPIEPVAQVPQNAAMFTVRNAQYDNDGFNVTVNFLTDTATWYSPVSAIDIDHPFILVATNEKVSYYVTLNRELGNATEVSFDIEFE